MSRWRSRCTELSYTLAIAAFFLYPHSDLEKCTSPGLGRDINQTHSDEITYHYLLHRLPGHCLL